MAPSARDDIGHVSLGSGQMEKELLDGKKRENDSSVQIQWKDKEGEEEENKVEKFKEDMEETDMLLQESQSKTSKSDKHLLSWSMIERLYGRLSSLIFSREPRQLDGKETWAGLLNRTEKNKLVQVLESFIHRVFPILAVLQWWFFNVLLILLNKWIFQVYHFNFPITLTALHFGVSFIGAYLCIKTMGLKPLAKVSREDLLFRLFPMAVVTNLNVCLGNVSLRWIPVTFMQTVKAFTPATTVFLQRIFQGKSFDSRVYISLLPVVGGVAMASATELSFHLLGFLAAFTSTVFTSVNSILAETLLKGRVDMDSINTLYYIAPQDFMMLAPLSFLLEAKDVVRWLYNTPDTRPALAAILISTILAFGLNFSLFFAIKATSAMTFNVAGNLKVAVAMVLGWLIYRNPMSFYSCIGCGVTVAGCTWYGYVQHKVKMESQSASSLSHQPLNKTQSLEEGPDKL